MSNEPERERMTDEHIDCDLCGGTEEVEIVPHDSEETLGRAGTYGCPKCIERKLRADLAAMTERATIAEQQRDAALEGLENIDTYKLNMLAEWIDLKTQDNPDKEVQSDLRAWARSIDDTLARIREMGSQGWAKAAEAEAEIERLREIQRVQVKNLLLSVEGSWQAFGYEIREAIGNTNYNLIAENANELRAALGSDQALAPKETTDE